MSLGYETVLSFILKRLRPLNAKVVVATSMDQEDDPIAEEAERLQVPSVRGAKLDVLRRFCKVMEVLPGDTIVRVTADCPFIDPGLINEALEQFSSSAADYVANSLVRTFPRGLDFEVFSATALREADLRARDPLEREHVTPYIYRHPETFTLRTFRGPHLLGKERWVIDTPADLVNIRKYVEELGCKPEMTWLEILRRVGVTCEPMGGLTLRPAILADEDFLLAMKNDPMAVRFSRSGVMVNPVDHHEWFIQVLHNPATRIWVGVISDRLLGQVRIDVEDGTGRISFAIDPDQRGKGYGSNLISLLLEELKDDYQVTQLKADVHQDNLPSKRCFESNGFTADVAEGEFLSYHRPLIQGRA